MKKNEEENGDTEQIVSVSHEIFFLFYSSEEFRWVQIFVFLAYFA